MLNDVTTSVGVNFLTMATMRITNSPWRCRSWLPIQRRRQAYIQRRRRCSTQPRRRSGELRRRRLTTSDMSMTSPFCNNGGTLAYEYNYLLSQQSTKLHFYIWNVFLNGYATRCMCAGLPETAVNSVACTRCLILGKVSFTHVSQDILQARSNRLQMNFVEHSIAIQSLGVTESVMFSRSAEQLFDEVPTIDTDCITDLNYLQTLRSPMIMQAMITKVMLTLEHEGFTRFTSREQYDEVSYYNIVRLYLWIVERRLEQRCQSQDDEFARWPMSITLRQSALCILGYVTEYGCVTDKNGTTRAQLFTTRPLHSEFWATSRPLVIGPEPIWCNWCTYYVQVYKTTRRQSLVNRLGLHQDVNSEQQGDTQLVTLPMEPSVYVSQIVSVINDAEKTPLELLTTKYLSVWVWYMTTQRILRGVR